MSTSIDQQFVEFVVKSLVGNPDEVKVERSIDEKGVLLELTVAPDDLGRVIGKRGNTAQSIRTLLRALGTKNDARYNLKIVDVNGDSNPAPRPVKTDEDQQQAPADTGDDQPAPPADEGANRWAHLASQSSDGNDGDTDKDDSTDDNAESEEKPDEKSSSVVEKTRKELEDLADINI